MISEIFASPIGQIIVLFSVSNSFASPSAPTPPAVGVYTSCLATEPTLPLFAIFALAASTGAVGEVVLYSVTFTTDCTFLSPNEIRYVESLAGFVDQFTSGVATFVEPT